MPEKTPTDSVSRQAVFAGLPPVSQPDLFPEIQERLAEMAGKVVVLDDDPTGTQTVFDVPVLTGWDERMLEQEFRGRHSLFFILTNSRSLPLPEAKRVNREIGENLARVSRKTGKSMLVVSRSDSTLRGHFPGELTALEEGLGQRADAWLLIPFFLEGGRYTINDVHYVAEGEWLVPAAGTPFARDASFGYGSSNLRHWVAEKTAGAVPAGQVVSLSLEDLRIRGVEYVTKVLLSLRGGTVCIVNGSGLGDMEVLLAAALRARQGGKVLLFRTAASFVQVCAGIRHGALLQTDKLMAGTSAGGLTVVGSYVPKTTEQLRQLLLSTDVAPLEVAAAALLSPATYEATVAKTARAADELLSAGRDTVIYTSRNLIKAAEAEGNLAIGQQISRGLVHILRGITVRPRYLVAKGGITSSDLATKGLGVKRAMVAGQILPGIPVWQLGEESVFPGLPYVVFPGNVGGPEALKAIVQQLKAGQK